MPTSIHARIYLQDSWLPMSLAGELWKRYAMLYVKDQQINASLFHILFTYMYDDLFANL